MVYKFNPLEMVLDFEDRVYELGDTVKVQVTLTANGASNVRGGRIDLVCEEHYSQTGTTFVPDTYASSTGAGQGTAGSTRNVGKERKKIVVHSTVSFLEPGRIVGGTPSVHTTSLQVQPSPPPHFEESIALQADAQSSWTFSWTLVATVDVVRGRNPSVGRVVRVNLPKEPVEGKVDAKPRMTTSKRRTGPSAGE
tara:strand:+ start:294 stop:878 length:585 start_codon:yes stop_codon:yes gene_type:complete